MKHRMWLLATILISILPAMCFGNTEARTVFAADHGLIADGVSDDGPAIRRMLSVLGTKDQPVKMVFPANKQIYVATGSSRYVFNLEKVDDLVIDGNGSTFLLAPEVRFMSLVECRGVTVHNLNVDYVPLPFVEGEVVEEDLQAASLVVRFPEAPVPGLGGPTDEDGEQAFFAMLWREGAYGKTTEHLAIETVTQLDDRHWAVKVEPVEFGLWNSPISAGSILTIPVPGIAHRYGPGTNILIAGCGEIEFSDVEVWSAPWFAISIYRNPGSVTFERVHVRPKPGSGRLSSSWRDGMHVKGNSGKLVFSNCILEGMHDDAFNVSTLSSSIIEVYSPTSFLMRQNFPIEYIPPNRTGNMRIIDPENNRLIGDYPIVSLSEVPSSKTAKNSDKHPALDIRVEVDRPVDGLRRGLVLWDQTTSNPDTTIMNCTIRQSCRFQSEIDLQGNDITGFCWFYGADIEGPVPPGGTIRNNTFRRGRGNADTAVVIQGWRESGSHAPLTGKSAVGPFLIEGNRFFGNVELRGVNGLDWLNNQFPSQDGGLEILDCIVTRTEIR